MTHDTDGLRLAARDTIMVIAGTSGTSAWHLRPGQSLTADLGLDDTGLAILAGYQQRIAERLRHGPLACAIDPEAFREAQVWQVFSATLACAGFAMLHEAAIRTVMQDAQDALRAGAPGN